MFRKYLLTLTLIAALALTGTASAQADRYSAHSSGQWEGGIDNPCTGEHIDLTVSYSLSYSEVVDPAGTHHTLWKHSLHGSGTSLTSGATYQFQSLTLESGNWSYEPGGEFTWIGSGRLVGQGPDDNLIAHYRVHAADTPNGDLAVYFSHFSAECGG